VPRKAALSPRIIKWVRKNDENIFTVPANSLPIFDVCHEARDVALLYGQYRNISNGPTTLFFSPLVDYLFFDARWIDLVRDGPPTVLESEQSSDPLDNILPQFEDIRRIMVHPNYTNKRKKPTTAFSKLMQLEEILIGADEKSMGVQSKFLLSTVYDTKMYYAARVKRDNPNAKVPRIAIGCLGWRGAERMSMQHGDEDKRQIVGVFRKESEMLLHMRIVRAEEWRFIRESHKYGRPKLTLRRRQAAPGAEVVSPAEESNNGPEETSPVNPPSYLEAVEDVAYQNKLLPGCIATPATESEAGDRG
jgi:hypothetical protein